MYEEGQGTQQDYAEAAHWLELSAKEGNPDSLNRLGAMLENGLGLKQDFQAAMRCYKLSAEKKNPAAYFSIGSMYEQHHGVEQDDMEAIRWYELAAALRASGGSLQNWLSVFKRPHCEARLQRGQELVSSDCPPGSHQFTNPAWRNA
jgi:TPR repeat protein